MARENPRWKQQLIAEELQRRAQIPAKISLIEKDAFPQQRALVRDDARVIVAHPGRRAGKTRGLCQRLCKAALTHGDSTIPFVHRTLTAGSSLMGWRTLRAINKEYELGAEFRTNPLRMVVFPGGGKVWFVGADKEDQIEKLRGEAYPEAWIDEAGTYRRAILTTLVQDILEPALTDYDGVLGLAGTPSYFTKGIFHDLCTKAKHGASVHHWTMLDNPHIRDPKKVLRDRRARYGWDEDNATYLREYMGLWISDKGGLVYNGFDPVRNTYTGRIEDADELGRWNYVLGVDYGFRSPSAFAVLAYDRLQPRVRVIETNKQAGLLHTEVAIQIEKLHEVYGFSKVMVDAAEPALVEALVKRGRVMAEGAKKTEKMAHITIMNDEYRAGILQVNETHCDDYIQEMVSLPLTDNSTEDRLKEDTRVADNHICDAVLYGWRGCHHYYSEMERERKPLTRAQKAAREEKRLFESAAASTKEEDGWWKTSYEGDEDLLSQMGIRDWFE